MCACGTEARRLVRPRGAGPARAEPGRWRHGTAGPEHRQRRGRRPARPAAPRCAGQSRSWLSGCTARPCRASVEPGPHEPPARVDRVVAVAGQDQHAVRRSAAGRGRSRRAARAARAGARPRGPAGAAPRRSTTRLARDSASARSVSPSRCVPRVPRRRAAATPAARAVTGGGAEHPPVGDRPAVGASARRRHLHDAGLQVGEDVGADGAGRVRSAGDPPLLDVGGGERGVVPGRRRNQPDPPRIAQVASTAQAGVRGDDQARLDERAQARAPGRGRSGRTRAATRAGSTPMSTSSAP